MRLLVVTQYFYPENFRVNTLCAELVKRGHEVHVLTGYPQYPYGKIYSGYGFGLPYEKIWNGIHIHRVRVLPRGNTVIGLLLNCLTFVTSGNKWVKKTKLLFDAVYVFEVSPVTVGIPALKYKKKFNAPIFFNVQDLWPENVQYVLGINNSILIKYLSQLVNKIYDNSDYILCSSKGFIENIKKRGNYKDKLIYWPQFCIKPDFSKLKKPAVYDDNYFNIVFTGNIGNAQGLELILETARLTDNKIRWYLVGDGRAKKDLIEKAKAYNLDDKVFFINRVSEEEANEYVHYANCAYISFSDNKIFDLTLPAKLQTYLACATPILGAVSGESASIISESNTGLVSSKMPQDVCKKVYEIAKLDNNKIETMKQNAEKYFDENFNMDMLIDKFEKLLNKKKRKVND